MATTRTFPIRRVDSYSLDLNQDFMITWHRDGHLLNQPSAVLNSDRHQSLILGEGPGVRKLTGWVTTAFMRGGTSLEDMGRGGGGSEGSEQARKVGRGMTTLYSYREETNAARRTIKFDVPGVGSLNRCHQTCTRGNCELEMAQTSGYWG